MRDYSTLTADCLEAIKAIAKVAADRKATADTGKSASATLSTLAIRAYVAKQSDAIVEQVKASTDWSKAKSTWSAAVGLAKYLADGNKVPQGARKEPFTISGQSVSVLTSEHVESLAFPEASDTTIPALVKHTKTIKGARATEAAEAASHVETVITAFLGTANGKAEFAGDTPDTLYPRMLKDLPLFNRVMSEGAAAIEAAIIAADLAKSATDDETRALQVLEYVETCGENVLAMIADAVAKRQAPAEAIAA